MSCWSWHLQGEKLIYSIIHLFIRLFIYYLFCYSCRYLVIYSFIHLFEQNIGILSRRSRVANTDTWIQKCSEPEWDHTSRVELLFAFSQTKLSLSLNTFKYQELSLFEIYTLIFRFIFPKLGFWHYCNLYFVLSHVGLYHRTVSTIFHA